MSTPQTEAEVFIDRAPPRRDATPAAIPTPRPARPDAVEEQEKPLEPVDARVRASLGDLLRLDSVAATRVYWCGLALVALSLFVPRLLPLVDYPQHLALADIARRLADPHAPEQQTHLLNYFTYNGLFHILVARIGRIVPIELAGRLVVSFSLLLLGASSLALVRVLRRPPVYAALFLPLIFSFAVGWGFVNYALGTALAVTTVAFVAAALRRPTFGALLGVAVFGLLCAMTHVLAMLLLCLFAASIAPETAFRAVSARTLAARIGKSILRMTIALSPILVGAIWCLAVYREQYAWAPQLYKDATLEGSSPPIWQKLVYFGTWATGTHSDQTDQLLVVIAVVLALVGIGVGVGRVRRREAFDGEGGERESPPLILPLVALLAAYLATPMVLEATHLIFPRLTQMVVLAGVLAIPRFPARWTARVRVIALATGLLAGANLFVHSIVYAAETDDASRVIDDLPPGRRVTAVVWGGDTFSFRNGTLVHMAAYYAARKGGDWSFSFARFLSVPVRFKPGGGPPWPAKGWEFSPGDYDPRCKYARLFDVVIVKAPRDVRSDAGGEPEVRAIVFGKDASFPRLLSHHGEYWAFDTKGLPDDGKF